MKLVEKQPINYKIKQFKDLNSGDFFTTIGINYIINHNEIIYYKLSESEFTTNGNAVRLKISPNVIFIQDDREVILLENVELHYELERE